MDYSEIAKAVSELGFGAVSLAAVLIACWKLLSWGKAIVDNAMAQLERERERSSEVYGKLAKAIDEHSAQAREFHMEVRNAHGYQREEHKKMIENLDEQAKVLLRINGERHS